MVKIVKNPGNGRLNNLNDPDRPQCVNMIFVVNISGKKNCKNANITLSLQQNP